MKIKDKAQILSDLYFVTKNMPEWADFHKWADLGVPLAMAVTYGMATVNDSGEELINETYSMLIKVLGVPDVEYDDLQDIFDAAAK